MVLMTMNAAAVRDQRGARYSEKVHVPLYQLSNGYCGPKGPPSPPPAVNADVVAPSGWVEEYKWMTTTTVCLSVVQRSWSSL